MDNYIANDTKYRYLKLDTGNIKLQLYLDLSDSLYNVNPDLRKTVFEEEKNLEENMWRLQKTEHLKAEAVDLENDVKNKNAKVK